MFRVLIYLGVMLVAVSCKVSRDHNTMHHRLQADSISYIETVKIDTLHIPADSVFVPVPYTVLQRDTVIVVRNKWAQARVQVKDSVVYVTAACDSLQRLVLSYRSELHKIQSLHEDRKSEITIKQRTHAWWLMPLVIVLVVAAGLIILKPFLKLF